MAFPTVAAIGSPRNTGGTSTTSHPVPYPTGITAGQLLLCIAGIDGVTGTPAISGFTVLINTTGSSERLWVAYKIATGSESGNATLTTASEQVTAEIWRITNWHGTTPPEATATTGATSANGNPPSLTPSWGSEDTLWVATVAVNGGPDPLTAYPTGFTDNQNNFSTGGSGAAGHGRATRNEAIATKDPGTFTHTSQTWVAGTIAIRPAAGGGPQALDGKSKAGSSAKATLTVQVAPQQLDGKARASSKATANVALDLPLGGDLATTSSSAKASLSADRTLGAKANQASDAEGSLSILSLTLSGKVDAASSSTALMGLLIPLGGKG